MKDKYFTSKETLAFQFLMHMHTAKNVNTHCNSGNFSVFTVPPDLLECKDCPVKTEILEVTEQHKNLAAKTLEKFNNKVDHTNFFNVDKVEKILKLVGGILS